MPSGVRREAGDHSEHEDDGAVTELVVERTRELYAELRSIADVA